MQTTQPTQQLGKVKKKNFDNKKSRVKLVVYDQQNVSKTFYSFERDDKKGYEYTMKAMKERILAKYYNHKFKFAVFYNNSTDSILERISPERFAEKHAKATIKMLVYDSANQRHEFFPNDMERNQDPQFIIGSMSARILQVMMKNRFNAAMFYDMGTGEEIVKFSAYGVTGN